MADGTQLTLGAGGDLVSDEDLTGLPRGSPLLPQVGAANGNYKLERTKIVVGAYGQDAGDATFDAPLPAESRTQRQLAELAGLMSQDNNLAVEAHMSRGRNERATFFGLSRGTNTRGGR